MTKRMIVGVFVSILIAQSAGALGSVATSRSLPTWYAGLKKPSFNPPGWVFGPVWTILFTLMGIASYIVWSKGTGMRRVRLALVEYGVQLGLNATWSFLFFGLRNPYAAFIEIIFLWISILATIVMFMVVSVPAGILLIPYILWVSFAAVLNFYIWRLNK